MKTLLFVCLLVTGQEGEHKKTTTPGIEGLWMTTLDLGVQKLRLVVEIKKDGAGGYRGTLDSIDQSTFGIPLTSVTLKDDEIAWEVKSLGAKYVGKREGEKFAGTFTQATLALKVPLERIEKRPKVTRPQDPEKPYPYLEEEVSYENKSASSKVKLAGTLTLPKSTGPHPAVVLITGSGAQNRNEELFNHRPFLVLADHLTREGIAVLRVDDRGVGGSTGASPKDTSADFATDVQAGVNYLKTRKEIDPKRIGLIGHSEGGMIAPMVAVASPDDIAFLVLMAGTGVPGEDILYLQSEKIMRAGGGNDEAVIANKKVQTRMFGIIRTQKDPKESEKEMMAAFKEMIPDLPAALKAQFPSDDAIKMQVRILNNAWMRYFITYDPRPTLQKVRCPVLALNGEKDLQVIPEQNMPEIEKALKAGGNSTSKMVILPSLNHLFQTCTTGHIAEYGKIDETISPSALTTMSQWIKEQTGLSR